MDDFTEMYITTIYRNCKPHGPVVLTIDFSKHSSIEKWIVRCHSVQNGSFLMVFIENIVLAVTMIN